jgi:CheY-like chemotaxis protein
MTVLLVEDDPDDILFMKKAFARSCPGVALEIARDGEAALEKLALNVHAFTHLLLDLKLPKVSGLEVLTWIRAQPALALLHVIVLTSSTEESDLERTRALGIDGYYVKPVSFDELLQATRKICAQWGFLSESIPGSS